MPFGFRQRRRHPLFPRLKAHPAKRSPRLCSALSGTLEELRIAAVRGPRPETAVFVVVKRDRPFLTAAERDFLWEAFQVPSYLLLCSDDGMVLGYECEAQD